MKAKHLEFFFIVEKEFRLHAQTSALQILCATFNENYPIGLRRRLDFLDFHSKRNNLLQILYFDIKGGNPLFLTKNYQKSSINF